MARMLPAERPGRVPRERLSDGRETGSTPGQRLPTTLTHKAEESPVPSCPTVPPRLRLLPKPDRKPLFARYIGIDYSGAATPETPLQGLQVCEAPLDGEPTLVRTTNPRHSHWTRSGLAAWLIERLNEENVPTLVGIDHGFSFPWEYFKKYALSSYWPAFLNNFQKHWPTDADSMTVDCIRYGINGNGGARMGDSRWRRRCEVLCQAKSVFHFDVQGSVAKSTFTGLPWLRRIRKATAGRVHWWPFDGWEPPAGKSVVAEVYPRLFHNGFSQQALGLNPHQFDAYCVAAWTRQADQNGQLWKYFRPELHEVERKMAAYEGWILGVLEIPGQ